MNKQEAAQYLGVTTKTIERYVSAGRVKARYERGKTGSQLVVDQDELDRFRQELETPQPVQPRTDTDRHTPTGEASTALARLDGRGSALATVEDLTRHVAGVVVAAMREDRQGQTVDIAAKLMLTVDEAAAFAGIGKTAINAAIKAGALVAHHGYGRGRRIKRVDLEKWVGKL